MQGIKDDIELKGVIPRSFEQIFEKIAVDSSRQYLVRCSYLEIYNEELRDLLGKDVKNKLELKENVDSGVYVKDLTTWPVTTIAELEDLMYRGNEHRQVAATLMNSESSRSHSIFTITIESCTKIDGTHIKVGKLNLVDLAGSERQGKTGATGDRLKEAAKINLSLSALGNCISALVDGKSKHIPYRDSKLTRLLQDSLGGNSKTLMIATLSPATYNYEETLSTLRFASRVKTIKNKPKVNEDPKDALLKQYQDEIQKLKMAIAQKGQPRENTSPSKRSKAKTNLLGMQNAAEELQRAENIMSEAREKELKEMEEQITLEKQRLEASKDLHKKEKQEAAELLRKRQEELETEKNAKRNLEEQLLALEARLVDGGAGIKDQALIQKQQLEEQERLLEQQRLEQLAVEQQLAEKQKAQQTKTTHFSSLREEVEAQTKQLRELLATYTANQTLIQDQDDELRQAREQVSDNIRSCMAQLELRKSILVHFISNSEVQKLLQRAQWLPDDHIWQFQTLRSNPRLLDIPRPFLVATRTRAMCQAASQYIAQHDQNSRWCHDSLVQPALEIADKVAR